jgi:hypothetical protein
VHDVDARFDGRPTRSMEVTGYDSAHKKYFARSYDDQGSSDLFDISPTGHQWTIVGESVRFPGFGKSR